MYVCMYMPFSFMDPVYDNYTLSCKQLVMYKYLGLTSLKHNILAICVSLHEINILRVRLFQ